MRLLLAVFALACLPLHAGQVLMKREMFYGPGTYTAGSAGTNFATVSGTLYCKPGGPRLAGESGVGWSCDGNEGPDQNYGQLVLPQSRVPGAGAWVYVKELSSGESHVPLLWVTYNADTRLFNYGIYRNQLAAMFEYDATPVAYVTNVVDPTLSWIWLQITVSNSWAYYWYKVPGGALTKLGEKYLAGYGPEQYPGYMGVQPALGTYGYLNGRIGAFCGFTNDTLDAEYPADVMEPTNTARLTWYVDSVSGDDANTGLSPTNAWRSVAKISTESTSCGMFGGTNWQTGNELIINTPSPLWAHGTNLTLATPGLNVHAATTQTWWEVRGDKVLTNANLTKTGGYINTYQTADTEESIVVWEDEKWLNHVNGSSWAAVADALDSTQGSFWTDGSTLYLHPFGDSNPTTDGKVYTRSYESTDNQGLIVVNAANMRVADVRAGKSSDCDTVNGPNGGYIMGSGNSFGGKSVIEHCYLYYGGKHILGLVGDATGSDILIRDVDCEQGSPFAGGGGQTPFVSFMDRGINNIHRYVQCKCINTAGLIGSTNGSNPGYEAFYSHSTTSPTPWDLLEVRDCVANSNWGTAPAWTNSFTGGVLYGSVAWSPGATYDGVLFNGDGPRPFTTGSMMVRNCVLVARPGYFSTRTYTGAVTYVNCTIDMRAVTNEVWFLWRFDTSTLSFSNNVVILQTNGFPFYNFASADTIHADHNLYTLRPDNLACYEYDGSGVISFRQWQALGFDVSSKNIADARLDASYKPYGDSPAIGEVAPFIGHDFTGHLYGNRRTLGAYEYRPSGGFRGFMP